MARAQARVDAARRRMETWRRQLLMLLLLKVPAAPAPAIVSTSYDRFFFRHQSSDLHSAVWHRTVASLHTMLNTRRCQRNVDITKVCLSPCVDVVWFELCEE